MIQENIEKCQKVVQSSKKHENLQNLREITCQKYGNVRRKAINDINEIDDISFQTGIEYLIGEKKSGHKINRIKLLVGGNFSHFHIKLITFPQLNFRF